MTFWIYFSFAKSIARKRQGDVLPLPGWVRPAQLAIFIVFPLLAFENLSCITNLLVQFSYKFIAWLVEDCQFGTELLMNYSLRK